MPEGDTIYRAAVTLNRALSGKPVVRFESVFPALTRVHEDRPLTAGVVDRVESKGKHLLMYFSAGVVLRTHMRMNGSWHIYRPGERWRRPAREMRVLVATSDFVAVGFNIPDAEFVRAERVRKHAVLARLGPDVLDRDFDREDAIRRIHSRASSHIGDALLNQRVLAGLGNVYKSEILFTCRINPFALVGALSDEQLALVVDTGRKLLLTNVKSAFARSAPARPRRSRGGDGPNVAPMTTYAGYRRTTRRDNPRERLWVYGRAHLPCRACGTSIEVRKQGTDARLTYWCPQCQPS